MEQWGAENWISRDMLDGLLKKDTLVPGRVNTQEYQNSSSSRTLGVVSETSGARTYVNRTFHLADCNVDLIKKSPKMKRVVRIQMGE